MSEVTREKTDHLQLILPTTSEYALVSDINDNSQILDNAIWNLQNKGSENEGKFLIVASDGTVTPTEVPFANEGAY